MKRIIFITGTDTGVGKTVLTALLLSRLRSAGRNALAMKPFCAGSRRDARILHALEKECLTLDEVNPFYFDKPLAPAASPNKVPLRAVLDKIRALSKRCDILLIEGAGGLLAPLGENYTARELIGMLHAEVIVVGRNQLGVINHVSLTVAALQFIGKESVKVILMGLRNPDISARTNAEMLQNRVRGMRVLTLPYLGPLRQSSWETLGKSRGGKQILLGAKNTSLFLKKTLATFM